MNNKERRNALSVRKWTKLRVTVAETHLRLPHRNRPIETDEDQSFVTGFQTLHEVKMYATHAGHSLECGLITGRFPGLSPKIRRWVSNSKPDRAQRSLADADVLDLSVAGRLGHWLVLKDHVICLGHGGQIVHLGIRISLVGRIVRK